MNEFRINLIFLHSALVVLAIIFPLSSLGYLITALIVASSWIYQKNALFYLLIYFPLRPFLVEVNPGLSYLGDLIILLLFFQVLLTRKPEFIRWKKAYSFALIFIGILIVGLLSGLLTGISPVAGIFQVRALLIMFLLIFIIGESIWTKRDITHVTVLSLGTATLLCIQGLIEKVTLRNWLLPETWQNLDLAEANAMRIYGLVGNPNVLATYLMMVFFLSLFLNRENFRNYKWLPVVRILLMGTVLLTFSRGTILAFGFGVVVFYIFNRNWRTIVPLIIYSAVAVILIYFPVVFATDYVAESGYFDSQSVETQDDKTDSSPNKSNSYNKKNNVFIERFQEMFASDTIKASTEWGRLYVVFKGVEIFLDQPLIGTGFATYGDSATQSFGSPIYEEYGVPDHLYTDNQYIQILVETGIVGTLFFLIFLFLLLKKLWKLPKGSVRSTALAATAVLLVAGLFYNILEDKTFTMYYYLLIGYIISEMNLRRDAAS